MMKKAKEATQRPYRALNPAFEQMPNEALYSALCAATAPMSDGLAELQYRLMPVIKSIGEAFLTALSWTMEDAMQEALILLWELVQKRSYNPANEQKAGFCQFFRASWRMRLNKLFERLVMKSPVLFGNCTVGIHKGQKVYTCAYGFHEKAQRYREQHNERNRRYLQRKREAEGRVAKEKKPPMTEEEKKEKARIRQAEKFAALTPEEKRAKYDRDNERRRAKRAAETPEEKAARRARYAGYARARKERMAMA